MGLFRGLCSVVVSACRPGKSRVIKAVSYYRDKVKIIMLENSLEEGEGGMGVCLGNA